MRHKMRELYSVVCPVQPCKNEKTAPPFPVRHESCTLFHHFSFTAPLLVLTFTALFCCEPFPDCKFIFQYSFQISSSVVIKIASFAVQTHTTKEATSPVFLFALTFLNFYIQFTIKFQEGFIFYAFKKSMII